MDDFQFEKLMAQLPLLNKKQTQLLREQLKKNTSRPMLKDLITEDEWSVLNGLFERN